MKKEKVSCFKEWLPLDKRQFGILAIVAEGKGFNGNLTTLCQLLSLSPQTNNKRKLKETIEELTKKDFCRCSKNGQKYSIQNISKEQEILIDPAAIDDLRNRRYSVSSVAWEQVLKVYLWICQNSWDNVITNSMISHDLGGVSESTISKAKRVLIEEFGAINKQNENVKLDDGIFRTVGHHICANAWWSYKGRN